ncbi:MAG: NYN domain-containing protein [Candidatus Saccharimonadales bacterium]
MNILVDGENFRHQIAHVLVERGKLNDSHSYFSFDWRGFLAEVTGETDNTISYYTTHIKLPQVALPDKLARRISEISLAKRKHVADLTNQSIVVIKAGLLKVRETAPCVHCTKRTLVLQEKGVDVRVAIDLLQSGQNGATDLLLASSDSDLIPALTALRDNDIKVVYLCYAAWLNRAVAANVHKTLTFDDTAVLKYYRGN